MKDHCLAAVYPSGAHAWPHYACLYIEHACGVGVGGSIAGCDHCGEDCVCVCALACGCVLARACASLCVCVCAVCAFVRCARVCVCVCACVPVSVSLPVSLSLSVSVFVCARVPVMPVEPTARLMVAWSERPARWQ